VSWISTGGGDTTPPDAPTALATAVNGSSAALTWNAANDNVGVTKYNVHRSTTSGFVPSAAKRIAQPTGTSYTDAGLSPGTYYYLVTAEDAAGNVGPPSNEASATIANGAPTASIATPSATTTWKVDDVIAFSGSASDPQDGPLPASALSWTLIIHHCPSNCHTHTVQTWTGVAGGSFTTPDHEYPSYIELRLTATDSDGNTDTDSVELQPQTVQLSFATQPTGLQLAVGSTSQATPFTRTVIRGSSNSVSATTPQSQGGRQYAFSSWSDGGAQTHNVVANAAATYTATYSLVDTPPSAPSGLVATAVSSSQINFSWTASTDDVGVTGYSVERCQGAGCTDFVQVATPSGTTYNDTLLQAATSYSYRVRATDAADNFSPYSSVQGATTLAAGLCSRSSAVWLTGMEHGVVSTVGGGLFSGVASAPTADNTIARSGAYSLRIADASASSTVRALRSVTASNVIITRFAVRLSSLPTVTSNLAYVDSATDLVFRYDAATQRFQLVLGASTATWASPVSAGTWYLIDLRYDLSANLNVGDWRVNGVAQAQVSRSATPATANGFGMGATANASVYTANYDDVFVATQPTAYPIEDSRIVPLAPNSMGTSVGAGNFRNNDGTAIDANSWQRLDEVPMSSSSDYVRQLANSGTSYVELGLQDVAATCIREVSAVLAYHAAGSAADNGKTSIFDGLTESAVFSGDMSQTALQYKSAVLAPAGGIWSQGTLNGLVARVGYSTDSTPNPYWDSIIVEAAVP
jgi:chitodextrinase